MKKVVESLSVTTSTKGNPISISERIEDQPFEAFYYEPMDFDNPLYSPPLNPPRALSGVAIRTSSTENIPLALSLETTLKGKGKGKAVEASKRSKKKKWLSEMTASELSKFSSREKCTLQYEESAYVKKQKDAEDRARNIALTTKGGSSTGMPSPFSFF